MIEKIALRVFLTCAFLCGSTIITMFWWEPFEDIQRGTAPTLFVIGFFAFLVWATRIVYRFLALFERRG